MDPCVSLQAQVGEDPGADQQVIELGLTDEAQVVDVDDEAGDSGDDGQQESNFHKLRSLVDNSAVSSDENVSLIATEVVGLREKMVSLQGRLVPLFHLTTVRELWYICLER